MSNAARTAMQLGIAQAHYCICRVMGALVSYQSSCAGSTPVNLYVMPDKSTAEMRTSLKMRGRDLTRNFEVAIQTGFPPTDGIMEDDTITDELGIVYSVTKDSGDPLDAIFVLTGINTKIRQIGPTGD